MSRRWRVARLVAMALPLVAAPAVVSQQLPAPQGAVLFEGARLITGDGGPPIESSALLVQDGRVTWAINPKNVKGLEGHLKKEKVDILRGRGRPAMFGQGVSYRSSPGADPRDVARWTIFERCAASSADAICIAIHTARRTGNPPSR